MPKVEHAHATARDLILVRRPDAASGRADLLARRALAVEQFVVWQYEVGPIADVESAFHVDAVRHEPIHLAEQRIGIEHDTIPYGAANTGMQDPTRDLAKHELRFADVYGVAGVRAALIPHDPIGALGEHVDELALPFVAPLCANDDDGALLGIEHESPSGMASRSRERRFRPTQKNAPECPGR